MIALTWLHLLMLWADAAASAYVPGTLGGNDSDSEYSSDLPP